MYLPPIKVAHFNYELCRCSNMSDETTPKDVYQNNPPTVVLSFFCLGHQKQNIFQYLIYYLCCIIIIRYSNFKLIALKVLICKIKFVT